MIKKVIVLGASGFLGSQLVKKLKLNPAVDVFCGGTKENIMMPTNYCKLNLLSMKSLTQLKNFDIIINCTGQVTKPFNLCYRLNTEGIYNLVKTIKNTSNKIIHISTTSVYGTSKFCNETSPLNPETNYASVKAIAEYLLQKGIKSRNLTILRLSNLYGPSQTKGLAAYILKSYLTDKKLSFNNNGSLLRYYLHVKDCATLINDLIDQNTPSNIFNIIGSEIYSLIELINQFEDNFNTSFTKKFLNVRPLENINQIDDSKLKLYYDFKPKYRLFQHFEDQIKNHDK